VQPALDLVRDRIDLSHLPRLGVEQETWRALLDFDSSESPPRLSLRHLIWHTADVAITPPRTSPNSSPDGASGPANAPATATVRFLVELTLIFSPGSVEEVEASDVSIVEFDFEGGPVERAAKDDVRTALKPLSLPHLEYVQIWRRPLHRLPVHKDVPRLLRGLVICKSSGEELLMVGDVIKAMDTDAQVETLRQLMVVLATHLDGPQTVSHIQEKLGDYLHAGTGDVAGGLRYFLLESGLSETRLFVQVLKAIHQEIIFPAVYALRTSIHGQMPYKDMKGEWRVKVELSPQTVRVSHLRWEQAQSFDATEFFKFRWALALTFDRRMHSLNAATVHVLDYAFGPVTAAERQRVVSASLKPWLAPGTTYKRVWQAIGDEYGPWYTPGGEGGAADL